MKHFEILLCVAATTLVVVACDSAAESRLYAIEMQRKADDARGDTVEESPQDTAQHATASIATAKAAVIAVREEAQRTIEAAQAKVIAAEEEARRQLIAAHADLRYWSIPRLKDVDSDIARARNEALSQTDAAKTRFAVVMREVDAQRFTMHQDLATLDLRRADDWDRFKANFEVRMDALEARLRDARAQL